jgi:hypothetical protein
LSASKENTRWAIQTELRVRIGGELMVDLIEIAKPLAMLKSIRQASAKAHFAGVLLQEHWIGHRATAESLRKEKSLFSKENTDWAQSMMKPPKGENRA